MKYWITADTHFFHNKMIEYCGRKEGFEFQIQKGLQVVESEDILIHLGDICIGQDEKAHDMFIKPLPCRKWLIKGNHDKRSDTWYLKHGWDFVGRSIELRKFGKKIRLTHRPSPDGWHDINIHGHQHNNQSHDLIHDEDYYTIVSNKQKLFALEHTNMQPMTLRSLVEGV